MVESRQQRKARELKQKDTATLKKAFGGSAKVTTKTAGTSEKGTTTTLAKRSANLQAEADAAASAAKDNISVRSATRTETLTGQRPGPTLEKEQAIQSSLDQAREGGIPVLSSDDASAHEQVLRREGLSVTLPATGISITGGLPRASYDALKSNAAIANIGKIAKSGIVKKITNTKTVRLTRNYLELVWHTAKSPKAVGAIAAGALLTAIGSYPFAGFIQEEALQSLEFGTNAAIRNDDIVGIEESLALRNEILNPTAIDNLIAGIPLANVVGELRDFFKAAEIKVEIDTRIVEEMKREIAEGVSEDGETNAFEERLTRIREEELAMDKAAIDYYNDERKKIIAWEAEARAAGNEKAARLWAKHAAEQRKKEAEDRKAIADFWFAYRKRLQEINDFNRPSKLNFGLL